MATRKKKGVSSQLDAANQGTGMGAPPGLLAVNEGGYVAGGAGSPEDSPGIQPSDAAGENEAVGPSIDLESNLSIQNVAQLYGRLKKAYAAHDAIEIDASHVNSVDTASLQLFVALKKDAMKNNKQVDFFQPSARLLDWLDILEIIHV
jgi:ABC-type transporter Mla MlaB component